jgi:H+/gluconate symporter-like permease
MSVDVFTRGLRGFVGLVAFVASAGVVLGMLPSVASGTR